MPYIIRGKICGLLCDECSEPLTHARIRLYRVSDLRAAALETGAETKETLRLLTDKEVEARSNLLLAEAELDNAGEFKALIPEKADYQGEALAVALEILRAPGQEEAPRRSLPVHVTIWQPSWRQTPAEATAIFEYCLPWRFWCYLRGLLDAWVICGRVLDCQTKRPLGNVRVVAFDEDWIQDDRVGEAITDLDGRFRIHYRSRDFKQTFLSPIGINIETPFPPYNSGPDLYFRVETLDRTPLVLLEEAPARGRAADRSNVGPCFCVTLCAELDFGGPGGYVPALFTHVGQYDIDSEINSSTGRTQDAEANVFTRTIGLKGQLPGGNADNAMQYRFRIIHLNSSTELSAAEINNLIEPTVIGMLTRRFPHDPSVPSSSPETGYMRSFPFWLNNPGETYNVTPDGSGWIEVPRLNDLDTVGQFQAVSAEPEFALARVNTAQLFTHPLIDLTAPAAHVAGDQIPPADRYTGSTQLFRIVFEAREVGSAVISHSNTLSRIAVWNGNFQMLRHPSWSGGNVVLKGVAMIDIAEITAGGGLGCQKITNTLTARYSAYHPYLERARMIISGPSGDFGSISPALDADPEASGAHVYDFSGRPSCAYILKFWAYYRLTSGYGRLSDAYDYDEIAFCKA